MPSRIAILFLLSSGTGCGSLWRDVPKPPPADPKVHFDAAWVSEDSSPEAIARAAEQRRQQIEKTVADRSAGNVGVPLNQAIAPDQAMAPESVGTGSLPAAPQPAIAASTPSPSEGRQVTGGLQPPPMLAAAPPQPQKTAAATPAAQTAPTAGSVAPTAPASRQGKIIIEVAGGGTFVR